DVVLEVSTDTRQVLDDRDAEAMQLRLVTDARLHKQFWCVNGSQGQHDLCRGANAVQLVVAYELNSAGGFAAKSQAGDQCLGEDGQVRTVQVRKNEGAENGLSPTFPNAHIADRDPAVALHHHAILIIKRRYAGGCECLDDGSGQRVRVGSR